MVATKTKRGAPKGNKNAANSAETNPWKSAINRVIAQGGAVKVRRAAESLLDQAANGEQWAIKELGDRLDGKAVQAIDGKMDMSVTVEIVKFADSHPG